MSTSKPPKIEALLAIIQEQSTIIAALEARVKELEAEIARLRKDPPAGVARAVPAFVKPNVKSIQPPAAKQQRKPRSQSHGRRREPPTRVVVHAVEQCPDCGRQLAGGWVHRVRQVIEIPQVAYEVIEHRMLRRHCGVCRKDHMARPDLTLEVVGRHRVGIRLMSLVVTLKKAHRMTVRGIKRLLFSLYGLRLSVGEIVDLLHAAAGRGRSQYEQLLAGIRKSPCVQADETSWRENGRNHWLWSFSTPDTRLFVEDKSRGHHVPKAVLGEEWSGVLASDFYSGYSFYLGAHQRCWVHFLRDLKELQEKHPDNRSLTRWATKVIRVWKDALRFRSEDRHKRLSARERFQDRLVALGEPYATAEVVYRLLAARIMRFSNEMFTFVEHPYVPPDNNSAERAIRPAVIYRKVTGGSRSPNGSATTAVLLSLVGTWSLRSEDPIIACSKMLQTSPHKS